MVRKSSSPRKLSVYSNLAHKRRTRKDAKARKKAEYLATLPKHPVKRILYRLHPKRVYKYWFSKQGALMAAKIAGVTALLLVLLVGGLFAYYRKDIDSIRPGELAKNVRTTVTKYVDRNGKLLWEDKGDGDYTLAVKSEEISKYMKDATIAIEDRDFYNHHGVSPTGLLRAFLNNAGGGSTQGGSTLTQQLVKQVFFPPDEYQKRGLDGIPRKIKELILSIEVERMYNKEQILTLYLNESSYGGRRNGVESAAQTYFGKEVHAKDLNLAQASMLAAIPNQPGLYDPYNVAGHEALIARQHKVLANMVEQGSITQKEADEAKQVAILDTIKSEASQYVDIKAPHFVQSVRKQLEAELGKATVGQGGLTVKTTLDLRIQEKLDEAMKEEFQSTRPDANGYSNGAATVEDNKTGQILALIGSRGWEAEGIGQDNAAEAFIQPGSSIKPLVFAQFFKDRGPGKQYGSGSILRDEPINDIYGAKLQNADRAFKGNLTIRQGLAQSRNVPAVKAMHDAGVQPTLQTIRELGDKYYCTRGSEVETGLASAIGGCGTRQVDHVNAFATLARNGSYIKQSSVLEVKNSEGQVIKKWKDESKQVLDAQISYILTDILHDPNARRPLFGNITRGFSYENTGIRTATKTGTSDFEGKAKDLWIMTYSPAITMGVWLGNSDNRTLRAGNSTLPGYIVDKVMRYAHLEIYGKEGKWKPNDWYSQPQGIQVMGRNGTKELYPSWYKKGQEQSAKQAFDKISKKKATNCTPEAAKIELDVIKSTDPVTKREVLVAPSGYDGSKDDDKHKCDDAKPTIGGITVTRISGDEHRITVNVGQGTHGLQQLEIKVGGTTINSVPISSGGEYSATYNIPSSTSVGARVTDSALYTTEVSNEYVPM